jgi:hypothetical protein
MKIKHCGLAVVILFFVVLPCKAQSYSILSCDEVKRGISYREFLADVTEFKNKTPNAKEVKNDAISFSVLETAGEIFQFIPQLNPVYIDSYWLTIFEKDNKRYAVYFYYNKSSKTAVAKNGKSVPMPYRWFLYAL